jgi:hypothetical protein
MHSGQGGGRAARGRRCLPSWLPGPQPLMPWCAWSVPAPVTGAAACTLQAEGSRGSTPTPPSGGRARRPSSRHSHVGQPSPNSGARPCIPRPESSSHFTDASSAPSGDFLHSAVLGGDSGGLERSCTYLSAESGEEDADAESARAAHPGPSERPYSPDSWPAQSPAASPTPARHARSPGEPRGPPRPCCPRMRSAAAVPCAWWARARGGQAGSMRRTPAALQPAMGSLPCQPPASRARRVPPPLPLLLPPPPDPPRPALTPALPPAQAIPRPPHPGLVPAIDPAGDPSAPPRPAQQRRRMRPLPPPAARPARPRPSTTPHPQLRWATSPPPCRRGSRRRRRLQRAPRQQAAPARLPAAACSCWMRWASPAAPAWTAGGSPPSQKAWMPLFPGSPCCRTRWGLHTPRPQAGTHQLHPACNSRLAQTRPGATRPAPPRPMPLPSAGRLRRQRRRRIGEPAAAGRPGGQRAAPAR